MGCGKIERVTLPVLVRAPHDCLCTSGGVQQPLLKKRSFGRCKTQCGEENASFKFTFGMSGIEAVIAQFGDIHDGAIWVRKSHRFTAGP